MPRLIKFGFLVRKVQLCVILSVLVSIESVRCPAVTELEIRLLSRSSSDSRVEIVGPTVIKSPIFTKSIPASIAVIPRESLEVVAPSVRRANATFVVLCLTSDLYSIVYIMEQIEKHFNWRYGYPWVFLNDEPFGDRFKRYVK